MSLEIWVEIEMVRTFTRIASSLALMETKDSAVRLRSSKNLRTGATVKGYLDFCLTSVVIYRQRKLSNYYYIHKVN